MISGVRQTKSGRLAERVCVITGATSGFGLAIARLFASEGASLVLNGQRNDVGQGIARELRQSGTNAYFVCGDVGMSDTAQAIVASARENFGRIDSLVLNAGIANLALGPFWETSEDDYDKIFSVNVRGVWLCARAAVPLLTHGSTIVVMASVSSFRARRSEATYCASKGAVLQLARGMAADLADRGVRVNTLCPGICDTPLTRWFIERSEDPTRTESEYAFASSMRRMGTPAEIARATLFLASDESSFTTGASLVCDGGQTIG
jgi:meso-butanediol dehydrogenase / (S,S)-butanediol dehydrogenase / diacetyl reductase